MRVGMATPGFRIFRVRAPGDAGARLRELLHLLNAAALGYDVRLPRGALRYVDEVRNVIKANLRSSRVGSSRRYLRRPAPALLLMNFIERGRVMYGAKSAVVHIDLGRGLLYSKSLCSGLG
ncbi:MAG: hypothetical protein DRJ57_02435 [Thermoprotei archaeon]|nr:MAG: hypothetical protein DRJ57_02435 [Thermoprotei archaeon]